jgi:hypothetical protein
MKKEIDNTSKPSLHSDEQARVNKNSKTTTQDNASLTGRRRLLKGLGAVPMVMTLHSGAAMAAKSNNLEGCVGPQNGTPEDCVAEHDNYVRSVVVHPSGKDAEGIINPLYNNSEAERHKKLCLVTVDEKGDPIIDENNERTYVVEPLDRVVTTSCWTSFV